MFLKITEGSARERLTVYYPASGGRPDSQDCCDNKSNSDFLPCPQINENPEAAQFLQILNRENSVFRTLKCSPVETLSSDAISDFTFGTVWTVVIARELVSANTCEEQLKLAKEANMKLNSLPSGPGSGCRITIVPMTLYGAHSFELSVLKAEVWGLGLTEVDSRLAFRESLGALQTFFEVHSRLHRQELQMQQLRIDDISIAAGGSPRGDC